MNLSATTATETESRQNMEILYIQVSTVLEYVTITVTTIINHHNNRQKLGDFLLLLLLLWLWWLIMVAYGASVRFRFRCSVSVFGVRSSTTLSTRSRSISHLLLKPS